ncbi:MAG: hypothetical protein HY291_17285 [Planctomycetes bacterium]|nr:hypothetical protein [Planctomycetota bacterium]
MGEFEHVANDLQQERKVVFTAQSCKNFHQRMLICKHAFEQGAVPVNPFNLFGYFLYELVDRDLVRGGNNNLLKRCDELWVYGEISDGVLAEIHMFNKSGKPVRFFDISNLPDEVKEIPKNDIVFEDDVKQYRGTV